MAGEFTTFLAFGVGFLLLFSGVSRAETENEISAALSKAQSAITNPAERAKALQGNARAQDADRQINLLAGSPAKAQKIYEFAASILGTVANKNGGDPAKMQAFVEALTKNPASLANLLTPDQLKQLSALASEISAPAAVPTQKLP